MADSKLRLYHLFEIRQWFLENLFQLRPIFFICFDHIVEDFFGYFHAGNGLIEGEGLQDFLVGALDAAFHQQLFAVELLHHQALLEQRNPILPSLEVNATNL